VVLLIGLVVEAVHQLWAGDHAADLPVVDDWLHAGLILASSAICVWGARRRRTASSRAVWWCFAAALLLFALAEITWGALYSGGGDVPSPNPTDVLYLSTYPLFMAGLVLMVRARVLDVAWHRWLDGFVLVLIVATPGVLLLIEPVLANAPIDLLGQIVAVAYPLGDVLLLGAVGSVMGHDVGRGQAVGGIGDGKADQPHAHPRPAAPQTPGQQREAAEEPLPPSSNRHSSIFSATSEKIAKLVPPPSNVTPSG